jgi:hypothetical protein
MPEVVEELKNQGGEYLQGAGVCCLVFWTFVSMIRCAFRLLVDNPLLENS